MHISDYIAHLSDLLKAHGDLEVWRPETEFDPDVAPTPVVMCLARRNPNDLGNEYLDIQSHDFENNEYFTKIKKIVVI